MGSSEYQHNKLDRRSTVLPFYRASVLVYLQTTWQVRNSLLIVLLIRSSCCGREGSSLWPARSISFNFGEGSNVHRGHLQLKVWWSFCRLARFMMSHAWLALWSDWTLGSVIHSIPSIVATVLFWKWFTHLPTTVDVVEVWLLYLVINNILYFTALENQYVHVPQQIHVKTCHQSKLAANWNLPPTFIVAKLERAKPVSQLAASETGSTQPPTDTSPQTTS